MYLILYKIFVNFRLLANKWSVQLTKNHNQTQYQHESVAGTLTTLISSETLCGGSLSRVTRSKERFALPLSLFKLTVALLYAIKPVIKRDIAKKIFIRPSGRRIIESSWVSQENWITRKEWQHALENENASAHQFYKYTHCLEKEKVMKMTLPNEKNNFMLPYIYKIFLFKILLQNKMRLPSKICAMYLKKLNVEFINKTNFKYLYLNI